MKTFLNNSFKRHKKNNHNWEKIHRKSFWKKYPNSETVSLFENNFKSRKLKICELGIGSGNDQLYFRKKYKDVTGIDISSSAIKNTKKLLIKNKIKNLRNLYIMDIVDVYKLQNKFDVIYDFRGLSNLPKEYIKLFLKNVKEIMKKKSYLIFKLYSNKFKKRENDIINFGKSKNVHLSFFDFKESLKMINDH